VSDPIAPTADFDTTLSSPGIEVRPAAQRLRRSAAFGRDVLATRRAFENYLGVGVIAGVVLPSRIPPRRGWPRLMERRMQFRTRAGPTLETEVGNAWPIVEIFRDGHYDIPIDWSDVDRVLDVGGHVGAFATWLAVRAPNARVDVFEPEPRNFADLVANIARNQLGDRLIAVNAAVGARDERRVLTAPIRRDMSSFAPGAGRKIEVECVSLDRHIREGVAAPVDVVKLDCEGAEWEILPSLTDESLRLVRHFLIEFHAREPAEIDAAAHALRTRGLVTTTLASGPGPTEPSLFSTLWARWE
jgi:FkbM family methyltransferase